MFVLFVRILTIRIRENKLARIFTLKVLKKKNDFGDHNGVKSKEDYARVRA